MIYPAPPIKSERVTFPPGTNGGIIEGEGDEAEYLSDQDIAAGRIPNSTRTNKNDKEIGIETEHVYYIIIVYAYI